MGEFSKAFDWIDFARGLVRNAGGRRGRDEPPIHTFAVEMGGGIYYGQIGRRYLAGHQSAYNLEVVSFGWVKQDWLGTDPNPRFCAAFTSEELADVQSLICAAVPVWRTLTHRPAFLYESDQTHFMGEVVFRDGWALLKDDGGGVQ